MSTLPTTFEKSLQRLLTERPSCILCCARRPGPCAILRVLRGRLCRATAPRRSPRAGPRRARRRREGSHGPDNRGTRPASRSRRVRPSGCAPVRHNRHHAPGEFGQTCCRSAAGCLRRVQAPCRHPRGRCDHCHPRMDGL